MIDTSSVDYIQSIKTIVIIYESRYYDLFSLLKDKTYNKIIMGEIIWFMSLIKYLNTQKNVKIIHCLNNVNFMLNLEKYRFHNTFFIMDHQTIPETIKFINLNKTYCMCYWGNTNIKYLSLKNVLTPFDYKNNTTYLGFNLDILCPKINTNKYNNIGLLWGKNSEYINIKLVKFLCSKGIIFYATTNIKLDIEGVIHLGIMPNNEWYQLLHDVKFILGSGHPINGPTILEAIYYKTLIFCPKSQIQPFIYNSNNIINIDNFDKDEIYNKIKNIQYKKCIKTDTLCNSYLFGKRVQKIFNL